MCKESVEHSFSDMHCSAILWIALNIVQNCHIAAFCGYFFGNLHKSAPHNTHNNVWSILDTAFLFGTPLLSALLNEDQENQDSYLVDSSSLLSLYYVGVTLWGRVSWMRSRSLLSDAFWWLDGFLSMTTGLPGWNECSIKNQKMQKDGDGPTDVSVLCRALAIELGTLPIKLKITVAECVILSLHYAITGL